MLIFRKTLTIALILGLVPFVTVTGTYASTAGWSQTITDPDQFGPPGSTQTYFLDIKNLSSDRLQFGGGDISPPPGPYNDMNYFVVFADGAFRVEYFWNNLTRDPATGFLYLEPGQEINARFFYNSWTADAPVGTSVNGTVRNGFGGIFLGSSWSDTVSPIPEPTTMLLLGSGLLGLAGYGRKKLFKK